jgi:hypothetical protein
MAISKSTAAIALLATITLTGCATASQRFVAFGTRGQDAAKQMFDMQECEQVAKGHKEDPLTAAAMGAVGQGLVSGVAATAGGAIFGAILGNAGKGAQAGLIGLGVGAVLGLVQGIAENEARYGRIYQACMAARGYTTGG